MIDHSTRGQEVAKPVLLRTGRGYVLVVVPSNRYVDLQRIRKWLGNVPVEMASEDEMDHLFPNCERGAMPPFGSVYHIDTLVDDTLAMAMEFTAVKMVVHTGRIWAFQTVSIFLGLL